MGFYNHTAETERLLTENYERYYRLAYKLMRNQDDALDINIQEKDGSITNLGEKYGDQKKH